VNKEAAEVLKHIADKLDMPVGHLWNGLVAYAPFWFWKYVVLTSVFLVLGAVFSWISVKLYRSHKEKESIDDGFPIIAAGMAGLACAAIGLLSGAIYFGWALAALYAPEAWAAMYIMDMLRR
jgi:hypothetical protein